jgi:hypothetical protein
VPYRRVLQKADTKVEGEVQEIDWMKVRGGDESENIPMSTDTWERKEGRKDWLGNASDCSTGLRASQVANAELQNQKT